VVREMPLKLFLCSGFKADVLIIWNHEITHTFQWHAIVPN
jgi:hypothetical protein